MECRTFLGDLADRLRGKYPIGPEQENGEPEFGYRYFAQFTPPIQIEAAGRIEADKAEIARLREALKITSGVLNAVHPRAGLETVFIDDSAYLGEWTLDEILDLANAALNKEGE